MVFGAGTEPVAGRVRAALRGGARSLDQACRSRKSQCVGHSTGASQSVRATQGPETCGRGGCFAVRFSVSETAARESVAPLVRAGAACFAVLLGDAWPPRKASEWVSEAVALHRTMDDQLLAAAQAGDVSKLRELKANGANIESKVVNAVRLRVPASPVWQPCLTRLSCAERANAARIGGKTRPRGRRPCAGEGAARRSRGQEQRAWRVNAVRLRVQSPPRSGSLA